MRSKDLNRTNLGAYAPYVIGVTIVLFVVPILLAYRVGGPPLNFGLPATVLVGTIASVGLGRLGAALWQRHKGSRDVVFDDLLLWGFARRVLNERRVIKHADRLSKGLSSSDRRYALQKLARALESGDPYTHGHSDRVARHAYMIARAMKLPKDQREKIRLAGALHDVGKLSTPREVLTKPDRLTDEEFAIIKLHPGDGADMVADLGDDELTAMVRHHHERMDGTGYPHRLADEEIPLGARIISVADTFDAITSKRAYRPARKHKDAIDILTKEAGSQLDGDVVKAFITYYTGRRGIRVWLAITSTAPRMVEAVVETARTAIANAAVVGGAAAVVVSGAAGFPAVSPQSAPKAPVQAATLDTTEDALGDPAQLSTDDATNDKNVVIGSGRIKKGSDDDTNAPGSGDSESEASQGATDDTVASGGDGDSGGSGGSGSGSNSGSDDGMSSGGETETPSNDDPVAAPIDEPVDDPADALPEVPDSDDAGAGGGGGGSDGGGLIDEIVDTVEDTLPL